jgi:septal ring factor EnvC (AmiA/AmiB activator)
MGPARSLALAGTLLAMLAATGLAGAQVPGVADQQQKLRAAQAQSQVAQARSQALERAAAGERDQAVQARVQEAAAAERIKAAEADIQAAEARIAIVDRLFAAQRARVAVGQGPVVRLIAALQSMARRPPVLGLVQPGSTEDMVHVRAVLATAMPIVAARTADVRAELGRVRRLRIAAEAAVASLRDGRSRLESERSALAQLEARHSLRSNALGRSAMVESDRAMAMGERARDIVDQMESAGVASEVRAGLLALPGPLPRPTQASDKAGAVSRGRAPYRLPVAGQVVTGLGELSATGVRARGITLACAVNAPVVAPTGGTIVYAAGFRDYGGVVIIDHGQGWTTLVSGLGALSVRVGDRVTQGRAIGRASGGDTPRVTVELRRRGTPMDLTRLLD